MPKSIVKNDPGSARDLKEISKRLLLAAGVGDKLPTPRDDIIETAKLVKAGEIDLDDYIESLFSKAKKALFSGLKKVRGALAIGDRTIYISKDVPESQKPFLYFHEVAHDVIPWQKETYELFIDDSYTLTPEVEEDYDREANFVSAQLLFQGDRFTREARDFELSLKTGIKFKHEYDTSFHSTFWNYVATHYKSCALLVLRECKFVEFCGSKPERPYQLLYAVPSKSFYKEFGDMELPERLYCDNPIIQAVNDPLADLSDVVEGETRLRNVNGNPVDVEFEAWSNTYNIFVLLHKKERPLFSKRKVVFKS